MRKDLIPDHDEFDRMSSSEKIDALCTVYECSEKIRKAHYGQFVHRKWNPHPPIRFVFWWGHGGALYTESKTYRSWTGTDAVVAFNCEAPREAYREAKEVGLVRQVPQNYEPKAKLVLGT